jgi:uncharacterized membrane protein
MEYEIGTETKRQIVLKYRHKLKAVLVQHEVNSSDTEHMILLGDLIRIVEEHNNKTDVPWYDGDL